MESEDQVGREYLTDESTRCRDLTKVKKLEMVLDTDVMVLGEIGRRLPSLVQLKINGSNISSVRDLGTSLSGLKVLWLNRGNLTSLAGISAMSSLEELYVAFNYITDISPLAGLPNITTLDLEGNQITSRDDIQVLNECPRLTALSLEGNPISDERDYRSFINATLPTLQYLDDIDVSDSPSEEPVTPSRRVERAEPQEWTECEKEGNKDLANLIESMKRDIETKTEAETAGVTEAVMRARERQLVQESIKRSNTVLYTDVSGSRPGTAVRPSTTGRPLSMCGVRPGTAAAGGVARFHDTSVLKELPFDTSSATALTQGTSVFCGNPTKSLRNKKMDNNMVSSHTSSTLAQSLDTRGDDAVLESVIASKLTFTMSSDHSIDSSFITDGFTDALSLNDFAPIESSL